MTYFFNGLREQPFENEFRVLIPSQRVAQYDTHPEMMASTITDRVLVALNESAFDFILVNYANPDMVADLTHWHFDTFAITWRRAFPWFGGGRAQFVLDDDAHVTELKLDVPNDDFWFYELELKRVR